MPSAWNSPGPDLISCVARHLEEPAGLEVTMVGIPLWLYCDSHSLMLAIDDVDGKERYRPDHATDDHEIFQQTDTAVPATLRD